LSAFFFGQDLTPWKVEQDADHAKTDTQQDWHPALLCSLGDEGVLLLPDGKLKRAQPAG
jgi:hypothetical protein